MKNNIVLLLLLVATLVFSSCSRKCCSEPEGFFLDILYKTKEGKSLFSTPMNNDKGQYDTRKIEVYKNFTNNNVATKEPLDYWVKTREIYGNMGYSSVSLKLPTDDKRVTSLLIYLYPTTEVDTISYKGVGQNNFPQIKNIFFNGTCVENMNLNIIRHPSEKGAYYSLIVTKPD